MSLIGCVDLLADTCISGWAADDADPDRQMAVEILVNTRRVATIACPEFREDLREAGIGEGCKGFRYDPSAHLKPGRNSLEVRYAGTEIALQRGLGQWVKRRDGISDWEAAFIAALEAYREFRADDHICGIGAGADELEGVLRQAQLPYCKFTSLSVASAADAVRLPGKADVVICWAYATPSAECVRVLKRAVQDSLNQAGLLVVSFADARDACAKAKDALAECSVSTVGCESVLMASDGRRRLVAFAEIGGGQKAGVNGRPVIAHIHVPKCAGTSLRVLLTRHFGARHLLLYVDDTYFVYGDETVRSYLLQDPCTVGFSSHHVRAFPRWMAGREMLYVTFLRDPVEQFVSYLTHIKKYYATLTQSLLEVVPPDAPRLSLRDFARWLLSQKQDVPFRENHNVNFFARHSAPAARDSLKVAKEALEGFFFVGITERMDESMRKLRALAEAAGLNFPSDPLPVENTSFECRDDLSWINSEDEVGSLLLHSIEKDRELYDWAAARLDRLTCDGVTRPGA